MPNIREFEGGNLQFQESDRASEITSQAGRRIAALYSIKGNEISETGQRIDGTIKALGNPIVRYEEHQEISHGAKQAATTNLNLNKGWIATAKAANENDTSVAGRYNEEVIEPALAAFKQGFRTEGGRQWAEAQAARMRSHMSDKMATDMSQKAADAIVVNTAETRNIISNTVRDDPTGLDNALKDWESAVAALVATSPNLDVAHASKVQASILLHGQETITKSAIQGAIERNPDEGIKLANDPRYTKYISGADVKSLESYARQQMRLVEADRRNAMLWQKQAEQFAADNTTRDMLLNLNSGKPTITREDVNAAAQKGKTEPGSPGSLNLSGYEHMLKIMTLPPKEMVSPDTAKFNAIGIARDIWSGKIKTIEELRAKHAANEIDFERYKQLQKEFVDFKDGEGTPLGQARARFLKMYGEIINPKEYVSGQHLPGGIRKEFALFEYAHAQEARMRADGKDPHDLYKQGSKDFLGNSEAAQPVPAQQFMQEAKELRARSLGREPGKEDDKPPAAYPNAKKAPDGHWYIEKEPGKFFRVQ